VVVDVVELVVGGKVGVQGLHLPVELGLVVAVGDDLGHGVEHVKIVGGEPLGVVADGGFGLAGTASQQAKGQRQTGQRGADAACHGAVTGPFCCAASASSWASRSPKTHWRLAGVTTARRGIWALALFRRSSRVAASRGRKLASTTAGG